MEENLASNDILQNPPLIEVIIEMKWFLPPDSRGGPIDPNYKLLLGRLYDRVSREYPELESLPTSAMPEELARQIVQYRFRAAPNDWPLLQLGPGILTLNDTQKYRWTDFRARSVDAISKLFESYPKQSDLKINSLLLKYINAVAFDHPSDNIVAFLEDKMKVKIGLRNNLFINTEVKSLPQKLNWQSSFYCIKPQGIVCIGFFSAQRQGRPGLMWETAVQSTGPEIPSMPEQFENWIEAAHGIIHNWFFKLIEGELKRRFRDG